MLDRKVANAAGFTLVELLATVAIVGVLATLVLGIAPKVLARSQQAECTGNLRKLGAATQMYINENGGQLPMTGSAPYNSPPWYQPLVPYADAQMKKGSQLAISESGIKLFQCPAYRPPPERDVTYAPNVLSANLRQAAIEQPSKKIWLITSTDSYSVNYSGLQRVNFPHNGKANVLYFDGHSELVDEDSLKDIASYAFNPQSTR